MMRRPDRLLLWSWNAGGLTTDLWQELLLTLDLLPVVQRPEVVLLQETHWTEAITPNFTTSSWTVLSSPTTDCKAAGLVILLDKQLCARGTLTYADPLPGRVQHARLETKQWTVDLLNIYQKPLLAQKDQAKPARDLRRQVWHTLRQQIARIPTRHTLIIGGDHNCNLLPSACAGPRAHCPTSKHMPDQHLLQKLLEDHNLIQVNSWTRKAGPTYTHPTGRSFIDHVIVRQGQADSLTRQAHPLAIELAAWRQGGKHSPIVGTARLCSFHSLNRPVPPPRTWDHWSLVQKCKAWWDPQISHLRSLITEQLSSVTQVEDLDRMLVQQARLAFPPTSKPNRLALWQTPIMEGGLRAMWQAYREWKKPQGAGLRRILNAWKHYQLFQQKQKAFRKAGKEAKKHWFHARLHDLQRAAQSKDTRTLYAEIRTLAPKSKRFAVQLRDSHGNLQAASLQADQLEHHYKQLYTAPISEEPPSPPTIIQMQVTDQEVHRALQLLPVHKATPPGRATTSLWHCCADLIAPTLAELTRNMTCVPQQWRDAWLTLEACSIPARTVMDAYEAKPKCQGNQGGIQISLDLTSAFDVLSWDLISRSMEAAALPSELQDWVSSWYNEVRYFVRHLGWEKCITASRGVRQGCLLAPLLWSLCTGYLLTLLQQDVTPSWVVHCITCYADDFHASDRVDSYRSLDRATTRIGALLDLLADAHMCINQKKSAMLLRVRGGFAKRWLQQHKIICDSEPHLRIRTPKGRIYTFPLKEHHIYLGVTISYHSSAKHTIAHRLKAANQTWQRLRKILCSKGSLDVWKRVEIWKTTVLPTMLYGVGPSAPSLRDLQRLQHQLTRQLRAITHLFAHLSKVSTQDLYARFKVRRPEVGLFFFRNRRGGLPRTAVRDNTPSHPQDVASDVSSALVPVTIPAPAIDAPLIQRPEVLKMLSEGSWVTLASDSSVQKTLQHHCPVCFQWCADATGLKHHLAHAHASWLEHKMDLDTDEAKFFGQPDLGSLPPTKRQRPEGGFSTHPMIKGKAPTPPPTWDYTNGSDQWDNPWPTQATPTANHHYIGEQTIASLRQDITLYLFVKTGQGSIVSLLHQTAEKWRAEKEKTPCTLTYSLKIAMFKQLMIELHGRLAAVAKNPSETEKAKKLNWIDDRGNWRILKWDPAKMELQVDENQPAASTDDLLKQTVEMRKGVSEEALHRFRRYKRMTDQPTSEWIQFRMEISLRPLGDPVWSTLQKWIGQSVARLLPWRMCLSWPAGYEVPSWEARRFRDGHLNVLDRGPAYLPIPIPLCTGETCHLQWCVDAWHRQSCIHALTAAAPFLCLQLLRFHNEEGRMQRDLRPLKGHMTTVHMPVFRADNAELRNDLICTHAPYQVVAMALHSGEAPTEGHYRAVLNGQPFFGADKSWHTDDGRVACSCKSEDHTMHRIAAYVICLRYEPGLNSE
ncbi:unnamed protein product [Symbiodinium sp. CCMP2592]|nr:unnamed protein product [Symbiodinium sp. CCMP2592]